jgi:hypothetical protein
MLGALAWTTPADAQRFLAEAAGVARLREDISLLPLVRERTLLTLINQDLHKWDESALPSELNAIHSVLEQTLEPIVRGVRGYSMLNDRWRRMAQLPLGHNAINRMQIDDSIALGSTDAALWECRARLNTFADERAMPIPAWPSSRWSVRIFGIAFSDQTRRRQDADTLETYFVIGTGGPDTGALLPLAASERMSGNSKPVWSMQLFVQAATPLRLYIVGQHPTGDEFLDYADLPAGGADGEIRGAYGSRIWLHVEQRCR